METIVFIYIAIMIYKALINSLVLLIVLGMSTNVKLLTASYSRQKLIIEFLASLISLVISTSSTRLAAKRRLQRNVRNY